MTEKPLQKGIPWEQAVRGTSGQPVPKKENTMPQTQKTVNGGKRRAATEVDSTPPTPYQGKRRANPIIETHAVKTLPNLVPPQRDVEQQSDQEEKTPLTTMQEMLLNEELTHQLDVDLNLSEFNLDDDDDEPLSITEFNLPGYSEDTDLDEPALETILSQLPEPLTLTETEFGVEDNPFDVNAPVDEDSIIETPLMATLSEMSPEELNQLGHEEKLALAQQLSVEVAQTDYHLPTVTDRKSEKALKKQEKLNAKLEAKAAKAEAKKAKATKEKKIKKGKDKTLNTQEQLETATPNNSAEEPLTQTETPTLDEPTVETITLRPTAPTVTEPLAPAPTVETEDSEKPAVLDFLDFGPHKDEALTLGAAAIKNDELDVQEHLDLLRSQQNSKLATSAILAEVREKQIKEVEASTHFAPHVEANEIPSRRKKRKKDLSLEEIAELRAKEAESLKDEDFTQTPDTDLQKYIFLAAAIMAELALFVVWNMFSA